MCHWVFRAMHYPCSSASPKLTSTWATLCILAKGQACSQPKAGKRKAQRLLPRNCHHSGGIDSLPKPTARPGLKSPQIHSFDLLLNRILAGRNVELGKASLEVWLTKRDGCGSAEYPERAFSDTCPAWPVSGVGLGSHLWLWYCKTQMPWSSHEAQEPLPTETNIRAGAANVGISSAAPAGVSPGVWELQHIWLQGSSLCSINSDFQGLCCNSALAPALDPLPWILLVFFSTLILHNRTKNCALFSNVMNCSNSPPSSLGKRDYK